MHYLNDTDKFGWQREIEEVLFYETISVKDISITPFINLITHISLKMTK